VTDSAPQTDESRPVPPPEEEPAEARPRRPGLLIGSPFGIPVYVSPSWFVVALIITVTFGGNISKEVATAPVSYVVAFLFAVLLYASVIIHELSHALTARMFRMPVRAITINILGGDTQLDRESPTPGREFLIAFAGPLVNIVLAGLGLALRLLVPMSPVARLLVEALTFSNMAVGVFNLLPGTPLDGGRLLRAVIWKITGQQRTGTIVVAWIGRAVAVLVLAAGTLAAGRYEGSAGGWLVLVLWAAMIAGFMWLGATQTLQDVKVRDRIPLLQARRLARPATLVTAATPLAEAIRRANEAGAGALVVVDYDGRPTGLVSEHAVLATPQQRRPWIEVGDLARGLEPDLTLPADLAGEDLFVAVRRAPASEYLLIEADGHVYGVLAADDVNRAFTAG
jgi:Zn-dependent protease/CBS domain-containing protein